MKSMALSKASSGTFRVSAILAPGDVVARLGDLGLRTGGLVGILGNRGADGMVVACGDARLALDQDTAAKVRVVAAE